MTTAPGSNLGNLLQWPSATTGYRLHETSMTATLYRDDPVGYTHGKLDLVRDALDTHLERHPEDRERTTRRLDTFNALVHLITAMYLGDVDQLLTILDDLSRREPLDDDLIVTIRRPLLNAVMRPSVARHNVWHTYGAWPREHGELRKRIADPMMAHGLVLAFRRDPRHARQRGVPLAVDTCHAIPPLIGALARQASRRLNRPSKSTPSRRSSTTS